MSPLAYPLERNTIRRERRSNTFGMVRNGGTRPHQGWDLIAYPGTLCFAVADGRIKYARYNGDYGLTVVLEFSFRGRIYYAAYCHLSVALQREELNVSRGDLIGRTGNTGNAVSMRGEDQHLHFEIRTRLRPSGGLVDRVDPATLYHVTPLGFTHYENHGARLAVLGARPGIKVPGINVRD